MEILLVGTCHLSDTSDLNTLSEKDKRKYSDSDYEKLAIDLAKFQADQVFVEYPFHLQIFPKQNGLLFYMKAHESIKVIQYGHWSE